VRFAEIFKTELFSKFKQKAGCYISKIYDIMSPREKQAPLKAAFVFLGPLTSILPVQAGSRVR
jgi:hypothetical protein